MVEQGRVLLGDRDAQQAGIGCGTGVAAARALAPAITLMARNPAREAALMQTLACWAGGLTPRISLTPDTLLLEIGSCLRLFGGLEAIVVAARDGVQAQGLTLGLAAAPAPLAAQWLSRSGTAAMCLDARAMARCLDRLPIDVLPDRAATALHRFGAKTLADVRRLPAAQLARRIGMEAMQLLARAFGEHPDPRADFVFPERFALPLPLPAAVETAGALLFAARRLTSALAGWLAVRQAGVRGIKLRLRHRLGETELKLQFADPTAEAGRFERVLRERLDQLSLTAPVESILLEALDVSPLPGRSRPLFDDPGDEPEAIGALLERLAARLGEERIHRLAVHDDHRPECASRPAPLFGPSAPGHGTPLPRPLWLLDPPEPLTEVDGRPYAQGPLKLLAGPERIESGWWDGGEADGKAGGAPGDIRRDYFIALSATACWLWIYRECRAPGGWYLHGYFS